MKSKEQAQNIYVVYEGEVYPIENLTDYVTRYCTQENWMSDWLFVSAESPSHALKIAEIVDKGSKATPRVYTKILSVKEKRDRLIDKDLMTPKEIWELVEIPEHRSAMSFNQGWIVVK